MPRHPERESLEAERSMQYPEVLDRSVQELADHWQRQVFHSSWCGVQAITSPTDAWAIQEIVFEVEPDLIIEIGCFRGGTTLFLAHMLDAIGAGRVIGVESRRQRLHPRVLAHPRVHVIGDSGTDAVAEIEPLARGARVLVLEDSSHTYENTLSVCRAYADLVSVGSYLIVEDTNLGETERERGLDPARAVRDFVAEDGRFVVDRSREAFGLTTNPGGYLRRVF